MKKIKHYINTSKNFISSLLHKTKPNSIEDLQLQIENLQHSKVLDSHLSNMLKGVLSINNLRARDLMVPRAHIDYFEIDDDLDHILTNVLAHGHSRFPVLSEDQESIGLLFAKDLLKYLTEREVQEAREIHEMRLHEDSNSPDEHSASYISNQSPTHNADIEALTQVQLPEQGQIIDNNGFNLRNIIKPVSIIPESKRVTTLLQEFQTNHTHLALVVNEFGEISGLITIEDILEEIVGEISDEFDINEQNIRQISKTTFEVMATTYLEEFNEKFNIDLDSEEFDTIGGYIVNLLGYVPTKNEVIELESGRLILRVIVVEESRKIVKFRVRCNNMKGIETKPVDGSVVDLNEAETFGEQMHEEAQVQQAQADAAEVSNASKPRFTKKLKEIVHNVSAVLDDKSILKNNDNLDTDTVDTDNTSHSTSSSNTASTTASTTANNPHDQQIDGSLAQELASDQTSTDSNTESSTDTTNSVDTNPALANNHQAEQNTATDDLTSSNDLSVTASAQPNLVNKTITNSQTQVNTTKDLPKKSPTLESLNPSNSELEANSSPESTLDPQLSSATISSESLVDPQAQLTDEIFSQSNLSNQGHPNGLFESTTRSTKTSTRKSGNKNLRSEKLSDSISGRTKRETSSSECRERSNHCSDQQIRSISSERELIGSERRSDRSGQISSGRHQKQIWLLNSDQESNSTLAPNLDPNFDQKTAAANSHELATALHSESLTHPTDSANAVVLDKNLQPTEPGVIRAEEHAEQTVQTVLEQITPSQVMTSNHSTATPLDPTMSNSHSVKTNHKKRKRNGGKR